MWGKWYLLLFKMSVNHDPKDVSWVLRLWRTNSSVQWPWHSCLKNRKPQWENFSAPFLFQYNLMIFTEWLLHPSIWQLEIERDADTWTLLLRGSQSSGGDEDIPKNPQYVWSIKRGCSECLGNRERSNSYFAIKEGFMENMTHEIDLEGRMGLLTKKRKKRHFKPTEQ